MMDEVVFEKKLNELADEIASIPTAQRKKLIVLAQKTQDCHQRLKKSVDNLQESLDYLRVSVKYLLFDLESTRRENGYLKRLLDDKND